VALELPQGASLVMSWAKRQVNAKLKDKDRAMEVGLVPVATSVVEVEMPVGVETSVVGVEILAGELVEISAEAEVVTLAEVEGTSAAEVVETSNTR